MIELHVDELPGVGWVFPLDNSSTVNIKERQRIDWDRELEAIPEIQALGDKDVVFDVGAYIGDTTRLFLNRGAKVVAFEPQADAFYCLTRNCPEALCINAAIGNGERVTPIGGVGGNTGARHVEKTDKGMIAHRLDDFPIFSRLTFLKVDVEGFEPAVLAGAFKTLIVHRPIIHIEVNPTALGVHGYTDGDVMRVLYQLGYTYRKTFSYGDLHWDLICHPQK